MRAALANSERSAQKLAVRVREVIDQVDQTTLLVKSLHETRNPMNLAALRDASLDASDVTRAVLITDRRGLVEDRTSDDVPMNIADEDEFKHHLRVRDRRLTLALPAPNPLAGGWTIPAMRRIERVAGSFDGVVVAYIDPGALTRGFDAGEAPGTSLGVLGEDNVYRALLFKGKLIVGDEVDRVALLADAEKVEKTFEPIVNPLDGKLCFVSIVPVDRYPLYAVVTASSDDVMALYRPTQHAVLVGAAVIALLVSSAALMLWQQARRLDTSRRRANRAETLYRTTSEGSLDALFMLTANRGDDGRIDDFIFTDANTRGVRLMRHAREDLVGVRLSDQLPELCETGYLTRCIEVVDRRIGFELELQLHGPDPAGEWLHHQVVPLEDGIAIISRDITASKTAQQQLDAMARLDALTHLPNRRSFEEHLEQATARARPQRKATDARLPRPRRLQARQRHARPRGGRSVADRGRKATESLRAHHRPRQPTRRRRVHRHPRRIRQPRRSARTVRTTAEFDLVAT